MTSYTHLINIIKSSNIIYEGNYASTLSLTQPDANGSFLKVTSGGAGTLSISDTSGTSESIIFTDAKFKGSVYEYTPTLLITCSGYTGTVSLTIESVDLSLNPIYLSSTANNIPCRITKVRQAGSMDMAILENVGSANKNIFVVRCPEYLDISIYDEFTINSINNKTFKVVTDPNDYTNVRSNVQIEKSFKAVIIKES